MRLSTLRVAEPCHADWDAMTGDARTRHCERCRLHVTDLSELTTAEGERLLASDGRLCVRYTRDEVGRIVNRTTRHEQLVGLLRLLAEQKASS